MNRFLAVFAVSTLILPLEAGTPDTLAEGYRDMYNLNFDAAHRVFQQYERENPADPMGPVSDGAAYLFYEFEHLNVLRSEFFTSNSNYLSMKRLKADPEVKREFEAALEHGKELADAMLKKDPNSREALLANVVRVALHADYLALIEKDNWDALQEVKMARMMADTLIQKYPDCYDAYLAEGVENYILSQKAAPLRLFLRMTGAETDKQEGIKKLRIVAEKGNYLKPYAKILLAIAALRDDHPDEAIGLLKQLEAKFPGNGLFRDELKKLCEPATPVCAS